MANKVGNMQTILNTVLINTDANIVGEGQSAVEIESQAMAVLSLLIAHSGQLVTREMLLKEVWQGKVVTDNSIHRVIAILRKALKDNSTDAQFIKTVHSKGYILVAEVKKPKHKKQQMIVSVLICCALFFILLVYWQQPIKTLKYINTGNETSLPGLEYLPQLSADGSELLFIHRKTLRSAESQLVIKSLHAQSQNVLFDFTGQAIAITWSDNKQKIALAIQDGEQCKVLQLTLNRKEITIASVEPLFECVPHSQIQLKWSFSNDGLHVLRADSAQSQTTRLFYFDLLKKQASLVSTNKITEIHGFARAPSSDELLLFQNEPNEQSTVWRKQPGQIESHVQTLPLAIEQVLWPSITQSWFLLASDKLYILEQNGEYEEIDNSYRLGIKNLSVASNNKLVYNTGVSRYHLTEQYLQNDSPTLLFQPSSLNEAAASVSPDGYSIAFLSDRRGKGWELWISEKGESRVIDTLNNTWLLATPQWRPDGGGLMLLSSSYQLFYVDIHTAKILKLTEPDSLVLAGIWADVHSIYYSKNIAEKFQLFKLNLSTLQEKQLTTDGGYFAQLSDNQETLYFNKRNQTGLWKIKLNDGVIEPIFTDFGADNYSRWQLLKDTLYYRHDKRQGFGLFKYAFQSESQPKQSAEQLHDDQNIWLFNVANDQSRVFISLQDIAFADIKSGYLKQ